MGVLVSATQLLLCKPESSVASLGLRGGCDALPAPTFSCCNERGAGIGGEEEASEPNEGQARYLKKTDLVVLSGCLLGNVLSASREQ